MTTNYIVTFSNGDNALHANDLQNTVLSRVPKSAKTGNGWTLGADLALLPLANQTSYKLTATLEALYRFLTQVFAQPAGNRFGVSFVQSDESDTVVVIHNDPDASGAQVEAAGVRYVPSDDVLISYDVFAVTFPNLFAPLDDVEDDTEAYETVTLAPTTEFVLAGFSAFAPDSEEQVTVMILNPPVGAKALMETFLGVPEATLYDDDHFLYEEPDSPIAIEALDFGSDRGPVVEVRFTVAETDAPKIQQIIAQSLNSEASTKGFLIVEEDFETFTFMVREIANDGTLLPATSITYNLD